MVSEKIEKLQVVITGACGRMGKEVMRAVLKDPELTLAGAVDLKFLNMDAGIVCEMEPCGILIEKQLENIIKEGQILVDFTEAKSALENIEIALKKGAYVVVGTTGFLSSDYEKIEKWTEIYQRSVLMAPNFSLGAALMMKFCQIAFNFFEKAEIVELHHDKKIDSPSGTAIRTAQLMFKSKKKKEEIKEIEDEREISRGKNLSGIRIHSVRLPGLLAHQEVIFGREGETLSVRVDAFSRECYVPGILMGIKKVKELKGLVIGLENIINFEI